MLVIELRVKYLITGQWLYRSTFLTCIPCTRCSAVTGGGSIGECDRSWTSSRIGASTRFPWTD